MRILFAVHSYYPAKDGVSIVTKYLAEGLAKEHSVKVITERKEDYKYTEIYQGVDIQRICVSKKNNKFYGDKKLYYDTIMKYNADILVIVCTQTWAFDWIKKILKEINCKKVLFSHGYSGLQYCTSGNPFFVRDNLLNRNIYAIRNFYYWKKYYNNAYKYLKNLNKIVYLSEYGTDYKYALEHSFNNGYILENAVEDVFFDNPIIENEKFYNQGSPVVFLCVANYNENKNQEMIINAFYSANMETAKLVLCGSSKNKYCDKLIDLKKELDVIYGEKKVEIKSGLPREKVYDLYSTSQVFVLASKIDQYPIVLCEAAAKGLTIISSDVGQASILPDCFIANSVKDMAESMEYVYSNPVLRLEIGKKMRDFSMKHYKKQTKIMQFNEMLKTL